MFETLWRGKNKFLPLYVPALSYLFSIYLINHNTINVYSDYVYYTSTASIIYLLTNMGIKLSVIRNNLLSKSIDVLLYLKQILLLFIIFSILIALILSTNEDMFIEIILLALSSLNLLLLDVMLSFHNAQGKIGKGYISFSIIPKSLFFLVIVLCLNMGVSFQYIYIYSTISSLIIIFYFINKEKIDDQKNITPASFFLPLSYKGEWSQIALYGLFTPAIIYYSGNYDPSKVKMVGVSLLIIQPISILYQSVVALNLKTFKDIAKSIENNRGIKFQKYYLIKYVFLFLSICHFIILACILDVFQIFIISKEFKQIIYIIAGLTYVNVIFGPNGTIIGLIGKSYYDAVIALSKIVCCIIVLLTTSSIYMTLVCACISEIIGNFIKNYFLCKLTNLKSSFAYTPLFISLIFIVVILNV